jgi:hypothetical protein
MAKTIIETAAKVYSWIQMGKIGDFLWILFHGFHRQDRNLPLLPEFKKIDSIQIIVI